MKLIINVCVVFMLLCGSAFAGNTLKFIVWNGTALYKLHFDGFVSDYNCAFSNNEPVVDRGDSTAMELSECSGGVAGYFKLSGYLPNSKKPTWSCKVAINMWAEYGRVYCVSGCSAGITVTGVDYSQTSREWIHDTHVTATVTFVVE